MTNLLANYINNVSLGANSTGGTYSGTFSWAPFLVIMSIALIFIILTVVSLWKVFKKAGKPGWAAIIPIYSTWVLFEIVGYPGWWSVLSIVPIINIFPAVVSLIAYFKLGKLFGKSDVFSVLLVIFSFICLPILAFGNASFQGKDNIKPPQNPDVPSSPLSPPPTQPPTVLPTPPTQIPQTPIQ